MSRKIATNIALGAITLIGLWIWYYHALPYLRERAFVSKLHTGEDMQSVERTAQEMHLERLRHTGQNANVHAYLVSQVYTMGCNAQVVVFVVFRNGVIAGYDRGDQSVCF